MTLKFLLILAACVFAAIAVILGFDLGWLGIDATDDYPGWVALSLLAFFASHLPIGGKS